MALAPGTQLGPYEIVSPLGAGGMGEVYRALDPRLGREVAIKVLPSSFSRDQDRLRRFEQEARAASALNHPSILAVYDIGTYEGAPYLVTELLEGSTLRDRVTGGALSPRKAVDYAIQIAQGLAAAHEKGIVHRDLKPENIFICRDGRAKILDFGLAKLSTPELGDATATTMDLQSPATEAGVVMGTAGYMSPEQVRGEKADQRSDIFSFGAVLYEALSGQRAFAGRTSADRASAILKEDPPDLIVTGRNIPAALDRIVRHCLEKNPEERFQSARDLAFHLESTSSVAVSGTGTAVALKTRKVVHPMRWMVAALAIALAAAGAWWLRGRTETGPKAVNFLRLTDFDGLEESPSFSPDGRSVVFVSDSTGSRQIWVRLLAGGPPLQITNGAGAHLEPRWSQDSSSIIYFSPSPQGDTQGSLWEVSALGGAPRQLASSMSGADVSRDGKRLTFFRLNGRQMELVVSDRDGTNPRVVMQAVTTFSYRQPRWSPDGFEIAFLHNQENWADDIYLVRSSGGQPRRITNESKIMGGLAWTPDGSHLIYSSSRGSTLLYLPTLHLWEVSKSGSDLRQLTFGESGDESPDVDGNGRIVVSRKHMQFDIWKFPVDGEPAENVRRGERITHQTGQVQTPTLDPTDREMAYLSDSGGHGNLWVMTLATGARRQITFEKDPLVVMGVPIWSPHGKLITFANSPPEESMRRGVGYKLLRPDGSDLRMLIPLGTWVTWSWDSKWLYYSESSPVQATGSFRLMKIPVEGGESALVRTDNARGPALSPDDSALYYLVPLQNLNGSLDYELRVARPESGPSKLLVRISGERIPLWQGLQGVTSKDGKWLVMPLTDTLGTNIWLVSTADGKLRQVTDFGKERTFIARRISWSADGRFVFAAVGDGDADIVQMDGLLK